MFKPQYPFKTISDVVETLRAKLPEVRGLFTQVEVLVRLLVVVPCSSAEAERSFSALRRLKTWLWSSMNEQHIDNSYCLTYGNLFRILTIKNGSE